MKTSTFEQRTRPTTASIPQFVPQVVAVAGNEDSDGTSSAGVAGASHVDGWSGLGEERVYDGNYDE